MKTASNIIEWGRILNFTNQSPIKVIGLDLETIDNEMFLIGLHKDKYEYTLDNFKNYLFDNLIELAKNNMHIATWTRYDNTHLLKLLIENMKEEEIKSFIEKCGKISGSYNTKLVKYIEPPLYTFIHNDFQINIDMVVRNCILFRIIDKHGNNKSVWSYDVRNLFVGYDLLEASKDYGFTWYTKISDDAHVINKKKFFSDKEYQSKVLLSNEYDSRLAKELAIKLQFDFYDIFGSFPKNLISAGSLARSAITALSKKLELSTTKLNAKSVIGNVKYVETTPELKYLNKNFDLLDYSMLAYHGGKIDSYVLGYTDNAYMIDITSAYPAILRELNGFNNAKINYGVGKPSITDYSYIFVKCNLYIKEDSNTFSTPFIIKNPLDNHTNLNPYGYVKNIVLTKFEYQFVLENLNKIDIEYIDYYYITSDKGYLIFRPIIDLLFKLRLEYKSEGKKSSESLVKTIINSLYGITYELNELYDNNLETIGYKSGDFFNPIIASHITAGTRTAIANMNNKILDRGGNILLNMTDSIIYQNCDITDLTEETKILGKFERPEIIENVLILGSGRYEYMSNLKYKFRTRGFTAKTSNKSFYKGILANKGQVENQTFITLFKSTTYNKDKDYHYTYKDIGRIEEDSYNIDPFNLGGKRDIVKDDLQVDLSVNMITTKQIYLDKFLFMEG